MRRTTIRRRLIEEDEPLKERDRNIEMEEMRRTIQQL